MGTHRYRNPLSKYTLNVRAKKLYRDLGEKPDFQKTEFTALPRDLGHVRQNGRCHRVPRAGLLYT